jgi:hypothetical protein
MSIAAPSRSGRSESRSYYSDDGNGGEYDAYRNRRRRDMSRHERAKRHEDCEDGTCNAVEKKYGGFGWEEGLTLAVIGGLALFNFDKAYEKHKQRSEEKEQAEKDRKDDEKNRRRTTRGDGGQRSYSPPHRSSTFPRRSMDDSRSTMRDREMDMERSRNGRRGTVYATSAASDRGDESLYHADQRRRQDMRRDSRRERYRSSDDWQRDRDYARRG